MNNLISDLTSFDGRINRQRWWIGVIVLIIIGIIIEWILGLILGTGMMVNPASVTDPTQVLGLVQRAAWGGIITTIVLAYPNLALGIKRRHDRNNNGYDVIGLFVLALIVNLLTAFGITAAVGIVTTIVGLVLLVLGIYLLVQLGFLKGTPGTNQYGPDPLGG